MIEIKHYGNNKVIHSGEFDSIKNCLEDGVKKGISFNYANLNHANLNHAELNSANLNHAELNGAELNYAKLNNAKLYNAELNGANLNYAKLNHAKLNYAELNNAKLNGAKLYNAELNHAKLYYAKLNHAELNNTKLNCDIDFSVWPLWCGSTKTIVSNRIAKQLAYHAICVMSKEQKAEFLKDPIKYANAFHRADECGLIKE